MRRYVLTAFFAAWLVTCGGQVYGQAPAEDTVSLEQLWTDAIYYLSIGRKDIGKANLTAFLMRSPEPLTVLKLSDKDASAERVLKKLQLDEELGELASRTLALIHRGWDVKRQDPVRIATELDRLGGSARARFAAMRRLKDSGEFAVPTILEYLGDTSKAHLHGRIIAALVELGHPTVDGLTVALLRVDSDGQLLIIEALAQLDYAQALPYIKQLAEDPEQSPSVRSRAGKAIETIYQRNPKYRTDANAGSMYYALARLYYRQDSAVRPPSTPPGLAGKGGVVDLPNIWLWREGRLINQPVAWELYYKLMTMRMARRALELDGSLDEAMTLWLLANCQREQRLSKKVADPLHGKGFPGSYNLLRFAGTDVCLAVLKSALADGDVAVAQQVLYVLAQTGSGSNILRPMGKYRPILQALNYPHQLVQLRAGLALAFSAPGEAFPGSDKVMVLVGKVLAGPAKPLAVLVMPQKQTSDQVRSIVESLGYEVAAYTSYDAFQKGLKPAGEKARIEMIVLDYALSTPRAGLIVKQLSRDPLLRVVPTFVMTTMDKAQEAEMTLAGNGQVAVLSGPADEATVGEMLGYLQKQLGREVVGPEQAQRMAQSAADAVARLATMKLSNFAVNRIRKQLSEVALRTIKTKKDWKLAYTCGKVLVELPDAQAQQSLASGALAERPDAENVAMLKLLLDSVRRHGNKLTSGQVERFQTIVLDGASVGVVKYATAILGALNLPSGQARKLIVTKEPFGGAID